MLAKTLRPLCGTSGLKAPSLAARANDCTIAIPVPRHHARLKSSSSESREKRESTESAEPKQDTEVEMTPAQMKIFEYFRHLTADAQEREIENVAPPISFARFRGGTGDGGKVSHRRRPWQLRRALDAAGPPVPRPDCRFGITVTEDVTEDVKEDVVGKSIDNLERISAKPPNRTKLERKIRASNPALPKSPVPRPIIPTEKCDAAQARATGRYQVLAADGPRLPVVLVNKRGSSKDGD
ncbi:uncharacterized protein DSM5745_07039 [Aspergillus mulundensis]|uniref:Uncharacterized protein n=1 Tax=Aspergillus mulundensis TaxID=1810919 RepID=A0A3D8RK00_9EURO|nr:hypothetical protein DSM5745_07039 [Aspergillus mulundensis]RDW74377.1 hypothetical protein DSM5745_07039 [Aspergillus mulundensis]